MQETSESVYFVFHFCDRFSMWVDDVLLI